MRALFPGTFDPPTNGHLDLLARLVNLCESVVVVVGVNGGKKPLFSVDERVKLLRECCQQWPNVEVISWAGLMVEAAHSVQAQVIVRGVRDSSELASELAMAQLNRELGGIESLLLPARAELIAISSSAVKEINTAGGDVTNFVPPMVLMALQRKKSSSILTAGYGE